MVPAMDELTPEELLAEGLERLRNADQAHEAAILGGMLRIARPGSEPEVLSGDQASSHAKHLRMTALSYLIAAHVAAELEATEYDDDEDDEPDELGEDIGDVKPA